jgi:hypothetical protein
MNHKRCKPKSSRAGCLLCKPYKRQGSPKPNRDKPSLKRKLQEPHEQSSQDVGSQE